MALEEGMDILVRARFCSSNDIQAVVAVPQITNNGALVRPDMRMMVPLSMVMADADYETLGRALAEKTRQCESQSSLLIAAKAEVERLRRQITTQDRTSVSQEQRHKISQALKVVLDELGIEPWSFDD